MKVYIAMQTVKHEGDYVLGVFSTRELAEAFNQKERNRVSTPSDASLSVEEYEVIDKRPTIGRITLMNSLGKE